MKIINAVKKGLQTVLSEGKILLIVYSANFFITLLVAIPMYTILNDSFGDSIVRENMMEDFDFDWFTEFQQDADGIAKTFRPAITGMGLLFEDIRFIFKGNFTQFGVLIFLVGLLYMTINTFFIGGALGIYSDEKRKFSASRFYSLCGSYFNRLYSLVFMSAIIYFLVYKLIAKGIEFLTNVLVSSVASEAGTFFINLFGVLLFFLILWFFNMIFDYAKAVVIIEDRESSAEALWIATKFVFRRLGKCLGLYYVIGGAGLIVMLVLLLISSSFTPRSIVATLIAFSLYQLFIMAKLITRLTFYSSQLIYYQANPIVKRRLPKA